MHMLQNQREIMAAGFPMMVNDQLGHLMVAHSGAISWDQLQAVKNAIWGGNARAIEVYPVASGVVNSGNFRHLWRLGAGDFCPDLLEHAAKLTPCADGLEGRCSAAWREAEAVFA